MDKLQQNFLMSEPVMAESDTVVISPLKGYFTQQFKLNKSEEALAYWQVFDRTTGEEIKNWSFDSEAETVTITGAAPWHSYTVNFLAVRLWEEISMYNHITNDWGDKEHLMAVDPRYPGLQYFLSLSGKDQSCGSAGVYHFARTLQQACGGRFRQAAGVAWTHRSVGPLV